MIFVRVSTGASTLKSVLAAVGMLILIAGCGGPSRAPEEPLTPRATSVLPRMRYTVQAGAFKEIANAVRLTQKLLSQKLFAYHFIDDSGFYKVRIGNFPSREEAIERAERLKAARIIDEYFIVAPGDYAAAKSDLAHEGLLRQEIVRTAERFIGVPYQWGGESSVSGFDCSGLAMVALPAERPGAAPHLRGAVAGGPAHPLPGSQGRRPGVFRHPRREKSLPRGDLHGRRHLPARAQPREYDPDGLPVERLFQDTLSRRPLLSLTGC